MTVKRGDIVQFKCDWDKEPTPANTSIVTRVSRNKSWADVITPFGRKRVNDPGMYLKVINDPLIVYLEV